jgi:hypothetical protein
VVIAWPSLMDRETVEEVKRPFGVVAEGVRGDVRAVARGLESLRDEMRREFRGVRPETARESEETPALIRLSHGRLDRRFSGLEGEVADLRTRRERVERQLAS